MTLRRCSNWPAELSAFLEERRALPFAWDTQNCSFTAADWIMRLVGVDPAAEWRGRVSGPLDAVRELEARGGLLAVVTDVFGRLGWPEVVVGLARRGDVVMVQTEQGPALGVCAGARSWFAGPVGLETIPTLQALKAWRIA